MDHMSKVDVVAREQIRMRVNKMQHMVTEAKQLLDKGSIVACCDKMQEASAYGKFDPCYLSLMEAVDIEHS